MKHSVRLAQSRFACLYGQKLLDGKHFFAVTVVKSGRGGVVAGIYSEKKRHYSSASVFGIRLFFGASSASGERAENAVYKLSIVIVSVLLHYLNSLADGNIYGDFFLVQALIYSKSQHGKAHLSDTVDLSLFAVFADDAVKLPSLLVNRLEQALYFIVKIELVRFCG